MKQFVDPAEVKATSARMRSYKLAQVPTDGSWKNRKLPPVCATNGILVIANSFQHISFDDVSWFSEEAIELEPPFSFSRFVRKVNKVRQHVGYKPVQRECIRTFFHNVSPFEGKTSMYDSNSKRRGKHAILP